MKPSFFNIFLYGYPDHEQSLVYNTRTFAMGVFENELAELLKNNTGKVLDLAPQEYASLLDEGFCIDDHQDELYMIENWFKELCFEKQTMTVTLLTTYRCDFSCPYCFEQNAEKQTWDMTEETAEKTCRWICEKAKQKNAGKIQIFFYGGEPLLNKSIIYLVSTFMHNFCNRHDISFNFGIVTNGYSIENSDTMEWSWLGLKFYRVSLDGTEKWHNKTRKRKDGSSTFTQIIKNIKNDNSGIPYIISGNFTEQNLTGILDLIEFLDQDGIKQKIHSLEFSPVMEILGKQCHFDTNHCFKSYDEEFCRMISAIQKKVKKHGFKNNRQTVGLQSCPFRIEDTDVTVSPEGDIYKCPATVGNHDFCVGNISKNLLNIRNYQFLSDERWKECFPCHYLPICRGGCSYKSLLTHDTMFQKDCPKNFFDKTLPNAIKTEYENLCL